MKNNDLYQLEILDMQYRLIQNLHKQRLLRNMSQKDIANLTGLSQQAVSRIETFQFLPSLPTLLKYMKALNLDINSLFEDKKDNSI